MGKFDIYWGYFLMRWSRERSSGRGDRRMIHDRHDEAEGKCTGLPRRRKESNGNGCPVR